MILILLAAAAVSFGIACYEANPREFFEPGLIVLIVILNAIMGVMQESKAEKALDALKNLSSPHARVIRDGKEQIIDAADLVPGDIIRLEAGDFVPAGCTLAAFGESQGRGIRSDWGICPVGKRRRRVHRRKGAARRPN